MKRVLFYGGASLLSNIWSRYWKENFDVYIGLHKKWIEIEGVKSIQLSEEINDLENLLKHYKIDIIVNCAGLANVEECEKNSDLAHYLNGYLPGELAKIAYMSKVKLLHISTDHLFDGEKKKSNETCTLNPLNTYAKSKAIGDNLVIENNSSALVLRTNFFGNGPSYKLSFSDKIISALNKNDIVVSNHRCHGHYIASTGDVTGLLAEIMGKNEGVCNGRGGSQHLHAGNFFSNGIQGNMFPVAAGMAYAEKIRKSCPHSVESLRLQTSIV